MPMSPNDQLQALVRQAVDPLRRELIATKMAFEQFKAEALKKPPSPKDEINAIQGRRLVYTPVRTQAFTATNDGQDGQAITFGVSQDGPFVMTHYPMFLWMPTAPTSATNYRRWRPVSSWPLPDQVMDSDIIDISYKMSDGGSTRNFQDGAVAGQLMSFPGGLEPLPEWTLFSPNSTISLTITYENILFDGSTPPTEGTLRVMLIGFKIVNL